MRVFAVMNFEPEGVDVKIGSIVTGHRGGVLLEMCHDGKGVKRPYGDLNAALADVRERRGWPNAYLVREVV